MALTCLLTLINSIIVFSYFKITLNISRSALEQAETSCVQVDGRVNASQ